MWGGRARAMRGQIRHLLLSRTGPCLPNGRGRARCRRGSLMLVHRLDELMNSCGAGGGGAAARTAGRMGGDTSRAVGSRGSCTDPRITAPQPHRSGPGPSRGPWRTLLAAAVASSGRNRRLLRGSTEWRRSRIPKQRRSARSAQRIGQQIRAPEARVAGQVNRLGCPCTISQLLAAAPACCSTRAARCCCTASACLTRTPGGEA